MGDVASFSFYPGKNLGAYGDAGCIVSNDRELVERVKLIANHGSATKYTHEMEGVNSRLDALQAAILRIKLRHLDSWNTKRRSHAAFYMDAFRGSHVIPVKVHEDAEAVWHLFVIRTADRDTLQEKLRDAGIATGIHYPLPLHQQPAYQYLQIPFGSLPITEKIAREIVSLPMYPELTDEQLVYVAKTIKDCMGRNLRQAA